MNNFEKIYLEILNEEKSPTSFTPESLLKDSIKKCYESLLGNYFIYSLQDIFDICENDLPFKPMFENCLEKCKTIADFQIVIIYFNDTNNLKEIFNEFIFTSHQWMYGKRLSETIKKNLLKKMLEFFSDESKIASNFNSIDKNHELGCVIGINGKRVNNYLEFEKELDHELNHYFEGIGYLSDENIQIKNDKNINDHILDVLFEFYNIERKNKSNKEMIENIRQHFFNDVEFRSMCSNVFHEIIIFNSNIFDKNKEIDKFKFLQMINENKFNEIPNGLKDAVIFSWVIKNISNERWNILRNGIEQACNEHMNIFKKLLIKTKDWLRNFIKRCLTK